MPFVGFLLEPGRESQNYFTLEIGKFVGGLREAR
jgi:hypothetical protein